MGGEIEHAVTSDHGGADVLCVRGGGREGGDAQHFPDKIGLDGLGLIASSRTPPCEKRLHLRRRDLRSVPCQKVTLRAAYGSRWADGSAVSAPETPIIDNWCRRFRITGRCRKCDCVQTALGDTCSTASADSGVDRGCRHGKLALPTTRRRRNRRRCPLGSSAARAEPRRW